VPVPASPIRIDLESSAFATASARWACCRRGAKPGTASDNGLPWSKKSLDLEFNDGGVEDTDNPTPAGKRWGQDWDLQYQVSMLVNTSPGIARTGRELVAELLHHPVGSTHTQQITSRLAGVLDDHPVSEQQGPVGFGQRV